MGGRRSGVMKAIRLGVEDSNFEEGGTKVWRYKGIVKVNRQIDT